ncbi:hypothetical protein CDL15_Pgr009625 [Punica granatum]|uniref:Uncharacterized protein n=1 Tax=Punica granatum TaxID=22663 RepID=A0A218WUD7_PUNGR|nr:hypothetical protein CDL15_Pgr009625 [Punica granatum]
MHSILSDYSCLVRVQLTRNSYSHLKCYCNQLEEPGWKQITTVGKAMAEIEHGLIEADGVQAPSCVRYHKAAEGKRNSDWD